MAKRGKIINVKRIDDVQLKFLLNTNLKCLMKYHIFYHSKIDFIIKNRKVKNNNSLWIRKKYILNPNFRLKILLHVFDTKAVFIGQKMLKCP